MRQNTFAAGTPLGELTALPRPPSWIWGEWGREQRERAREEKGKRGKWEGEGRERGKGEKEERGKGEGKRSPPEQKFWLRP